MMIQSKGFTLVEALATLMVVSVIAVLAVPTFSDFLQRQSVRADNQFALKAFTVARSQAIAATATSTVVCWNNTNVNVDMSDSSGGTTHILNPGQILVSEGTFADFGEIITRGNIVGDANVSFDNDADSCISFSAQGRMENSSVSPLSIVFCRALGDSEDSMRLEIAAGGRVSVKNNTDTTGAGVQACN